MGRELGWMAVGSWTQCPEKLLKGKTPGQKIYVCLYRPLYLNSLLIHFRMFANLVLKLVCSPLLLVWHSLQCLLINHKGC
jgi:hypothetical protein